MTKLENLTTTKPQTLFINSICLLLPINIKVRKPKAYDAHEPPTQKKENRLCNA